jgi:hypothetical protein
MRVRFKNVNSRHVPPFSGTWFLMTFFAVLVSFNRLTISKVSLWPFPGNRNSFLISFNDILRCELYCVVVRINLILATKNYHFRPTLS